MLVTVLAERMSSRPPPRLGVADGPRALTAGRIAVGALLLVALPGFVAAVGDILRAG